MTVDFVPWYHDYNSSWHMAVVEYIKKLPKNSTIAFEISTEVLAKADYTMYALNRVLEPSYTKPNAKKSILDIIDAAAPDVLSTYEILQECRKRNITVIPIESRTYSVASRKARDAGKYKLERENVFINQIKSALNKSKLKDLTVIVGPNHILNVYNAIKANGTKCNIVNLFPRFKDTNEFIEILRYVDSQLEARRRGIDVYDPKFESILNELTKVDFAKARRLVEDAKIIALNRENRTKRKLELAKNKQELRIREIKPK